MTFQLDDFKTDRECEVDGYGFALSDFAEAIEIVLSIRQDEISVRMLAEDFGTTDAVVLAAVFEADALFTRGDRLDPQRCVVEQSDLRSTDALELGVGVQALVVMRHADRPTVSVREAATIFGVTDAEIFEAVEEWPWLDTVGPADDPTRCILDVDGE